MTNVLKYVGVLAIMLFASGSSYAAAETTGSEGISNNDLFYVLVLVGGVITLCIFYMANAINGLVGSDFFKKKIHDKEEQKRQKGNKTNVITTILLIVVPFLGFSQGGGASAVESQIDKEWIWLMLSVDVVLLLILLYLRKVFNQLLGEVIPAKEKAKKKSVSRFNKVLVDAVPLEREAEIMTDHEYDGIKELDNNLPPWWLWSFYASIVFAVVYLLNYHVFKTSDLQAEEYEKSVIEQDKQIAEYLKSMKLNVDENTVVLLTEASDINAGKGIFNAKCVACHGKSGEGVIGPNLTDDYWLKGGDVKSIFTTIKYGTNKGMQAWKDELNPIEMQQVTSFIKSIRGTVTDGKEPQGELYVEEGVTAEVSDSTNSLDTIPVVLDSAGI